MKPPEGPDVDRDFIELSRRAYLALARAYTPGPAFLIPSFRLWHYPPEGPQVTWVVFQCRPSTPGDASPVVRRIRWDRDADLGRCREKRRRRPRLDPTLAADEARLHESLLTTFMDEAATLGLPFGQLIRPYLSDVRKEYGLEGYDVEGRDGRPIVRIEWNEPPRIRWGPSFDGRPKCANGSAACCPDSPPRGFLEEGRRGRL